MKFNIFYIVGFCGLIPCCNESSPSNQDVKLVERLRNIEEDAILKEKEYRSKIVELEAVNREYKQAFRLLMTRVEQIDMRLKASDKRFNQAMIDNVIDLHEIRESLSGDGK